MGWSGDRAQPNWEGTLDSIKECLESVLMGIEFGRQERVRADILALEALDELDSFLGGLKRDLGV